MGVCRAGTEGRVIHPLQVPVGVHLVNALVDLAVGLVGRADDELRSLADGAARGGRGEIVDPGHGVKDVFLQVLVRADAPHHVGFGRLDVHRQAAAQAVGAFHQFPAGSGHDLEVDVTSEPVLFADDLDGLHHALGGLGSVAGDAGAEEQAIDRETAVQFREGVGQLLALESVTLAGHVDAVGAVGAVHLAEVGEHHPHQVDFLAVGQAGLVDARSRVFARVGVGDAVRAASEGAGGELAAERMAAAVGFAGGEYVVGRGHAAEDLQLVVAVGRGLDEHGRVSPVRPWHRLPGNMANRCSHTRQGLVNTWMSLARTQFRGSSESGFAGFYDWTGLGELHRITAPILIILKS